MIHQYYVINIDILPILLLVTNIIVSTRKIGRLTGFVSEHYIFTQ